MSDKIIKIDVSSPDELRKALASHAKNGACFADLRVSGQSVLTRQFNFPKSSSKDLIAGLKMEASETLALAADDVEVTYQITGTASQGVQGIFSAMSRHLLAEYQECFKKYPLFPISLTAPVIAAIIDFLKDQPNAGDNFCLVNFLKQRAVNIIVFANAKPTFFRELYDLKESDFKDKITDTIRYASRHSANKNIDRIFFIGEIKGKDDLMKSIKELENPIKAEPSTTKTTGTLDLTSLNILGKYVLDLTERKKLFTIFSYISIVFILLGLFLTGHVIKENSKFQDLKSKVNMDDYNRALDLQGQLRRMNHV